MNRALAGWGKRLAMRAGLQVRRAGPGNRFEAMDDALRLLVARGYAPRVVIDGGSNVGQWAKLASAVFLEAHFHLIEPQPICQEQLRRSFSSARFTLHPVAITEPGVATVRMAAGKLGGTGAWVSDRLSADRDDVLTVPSATLDSLVGDTVTRVDRPLLKLDLEGHEVHALRGAVTLLREVEIIVCEVSFFDTSNDGRPLFGDVLLHLHASGFMSYDFATLYPRARDQRLRMADAIFVRKDSALLEDVAWD